MKAMTRCLALLQKSEPRFLLPPPCSTIELNDWHSSVLKDSHPDRNLGFHLQPKLQACQLIVRLELAANPHPAIFQNLD